jgi:hypothetical protein
VFSIVDLLRVRSTGARATNYVIWYYTRLTVIFKYPDLRRCPSCPHPSYLCHRWTRHGPPRGVDLDSMMPRRTTPSWHSPCAYRWRTRRTDRRRRSAVIFKYPDLRRCPSCPHPSYLCHRWTRHGPPRGYENDPELAFALRLSMEDEKNRQEKEKREREEQEGKYASQSYSNIRTLGGVHLVLILLIFVTAGLAMALLRVRSTGARAINYVIWYYTRRRDIRTQVQEQNVSSSSIRLRCRCDARHSIGIWGRG